MLVEISNFTPAVFAVGHNYQICLPVRVSCTFWVEIGDQTFYDATNGVMRSETEIHRVTVPMAVLDAAGAYTVCCRLIYDRKSYFSQLSEARKETFSFRPVRNENIRIYQIADTHGDHDFSTKAAKHFMEEHGGIDLLVLNGDVIDHSGHVEFFGNIFRIVTTLTNGEIPVVFSRGNHDLRGKAAEKMTDYFPHENGNLYYTFRLGTIWGMILDCGEDKPDDNIAYGGVIACHAFREQETLFIIDVIADAVREYRADGVEHRIVFCHIPFTFMYQTPELHIEEEIYSEWVRLLNDEIKPNVMLSGHEHICSIDYPGSERDTLSAKFPVIFSPAMDFTPPYYHGAGFVLKRKEIEVTFNDGEKNLSVLTMKTAE